MFEYFWSINILRIQRARCISEYNFLNQVGYLTNNYLISYTYGEMIIKYTIYSTSMMQKITMYICVF